jgi:hypothetical protein
MAVTVFWDMTPSSLPPSSGKKYGVGSYKNLSFYQFYGVTSSTKTELRIDSPDSRPG